MTTNEAMNSDFANKGYDLSHALLQAYTLQIAIENRSFLEIILKKQLELTELYISGTVNKDKVNETFDILYKEAIDNGQSMYFEAIAQIAAKTKSAD